MLYRGMNRAELDTAYNNSAAVPERDAIVADLGSTQRQGAVRMRLATVSGVSGAGSPPLMTPKITVLSQSPSRVLRARLGWAVTPIALAGSSPVAGLLSQNLR